MEITKSNHVWCSYITYIPVKRGFLYRVAIMDWATRHVLAWKLSNTMDGRGRCMDNIFIERLWRSLKYEAVYLHELTDGFKAKQVIDDWLNFYNNERPHSTFGGWPPAEVYDGSQPMDMMDKPSGLPTYPQAPQSQESVLKNVLVA